ncbi:Tetratricopeptide repeat protein 1 [Hordeum vulgare]|nr:Tetratricopeptide repeat protein 1 [Hordeum vulgare]
MLGVIELEPEHEREETTRPSLPLEFVEAPNPRRAEEDEEAFEDALTDEQLREDIWWCRAARVPLVGWLLGLVLAVDGLETTLKNEEDARIGS